MDKNLGTFTSDELYDKYKEYMDECRECQKEDEENEGEVATEEYWNDGDFQETEWEEVEEEELSFEEWMDMCGYYEVEEGIYTK